VRRRPFDPSDLPWAVSQCPFDPYRAGAKVYRPYRAYQAGRRPAPQTTLLPTLAFASTPVSAPASPAVPVDTETFKFRALCVITMMVKDSFLPHIMHIHDPRLVWIRLRDLYESKSINRRLTLKQQLYSLRMSERTTIDEHLRNIGSLTTQLANIGIVIADDELVDLVLTSLLPN
jgi:hypothetical protein